MSAILYEVKDFVAYVTLNRPEVLNCFNYATLKELEEVVEDIHHNNDVRVVIFTGAGKKLSVQELIKRKKNAHRIRSSP